MVVTFGMVAVSVSITTSVVLPRIAMIRAGVVMRIWTWTATISGVRGCGAMLAVFIESSSLVGIQPYPWWRSGASMSAHTSFWHFECWITDKVVWE